MPHTTADTWDYTAGLNDREQCIDTCYFVLQCYDTNSVDSLSPVYADDIEVSMVGFGPTDAPPTVGKAAVLEGQAKGPAMKMDTQHQVGNVRVAIDGDNAHLKAYVLAQHFPLGEGKDPSLQNYVLAGAKYDWDFRKENGKWLVRRMIISNGWTVGDMSIMKH